ncbi:hypothetical protein [Pseudescherichia sp. L3]|uniref:hypothetical protein n=1 Tax=Pseudescherichia sp. L3 TaxID=2970817 RepID=UPI00215059CA|nr:hypothetical protein [Pseudescherichia sp. L3]MCR4457052.1 hypothetical protein [Pseudescherichia sp. L3]
MLGFEVYNSNGALTIDSDNKSIVMSTVKGMGGLSDTGFYRFISDFGDGGNLGFLASDFFPATGLRWYQPQVNGSYCFPGASLFQANTGRFMICSNTTAIQSGYLDVFDGAGQLIWSAASAGTMPRIMDFFTVPSSHDLATTLTLNTAFADPWICISQCPGNISSDGTQGGYSGLLVRRLSSTQFQLQYINRFQKPYRTAMGNSGLRIALAYFTGY